MGRYRRKSKLTQLVSSLSGAKAREIDRALVYALQLDRCRARLPSGAIEILLILPSMATRHRQSGAYV